MLGIPDKVSAVNRTIVTNLLPRPAYSTRYTAEKIPRGAAKSKASTIILIVFTAAGTRLTFVLVYVQAKSPGVRFQTPSHKIYPSNRSSEEKVTSAAREVAAK